MNVKVFEEQDCLIHNNGSLPGGQLFDLGKKLIQSDGCPENRPDDLMTGSERTRRNWAFYHWCTPDQSTTISRRLVRSKTTSVPSSQSCDPRHLRIPIEL